MIHDITLLNSGAKPITVITATLNATHTKPAVTSDDPKAASPHLYFPEFAVQRGIRVEKELLPLRLEGGEARSVPIKLDFVMPSTTTPSKEEFEGSWFSGILELEFATTAGTLKRKCELHLNAYALNYNLRHVPGT